MEPGTIEGWLSLKQCHSNPNVLDVLRRGRKKKVMTDPGSYRLEKCFYRKMEKRVKAGIINK